MFLEGMGCKEHPFSKQGAGRIPHPDFSLGVLGTVAQACGGLGVLSLLGLQFLMVRLGRAQGLVCDLLAVP